MADKFAKLDICRPDHIGELAVYCPAPHFKVFCNDCYFEQNNNGQFSHVATTIKKAATEQISKLEIVFEKANEAMKFCTEMQSSMLNQESLEDEVMKKVNAKFEELQQIIELQKVEAVTTIKNLESVTEYRPPPRDLTKDTLGQIQGFIKEIEDQIKKQRQMSQEKGGHFSVLKEQGYLDIFLSKQKEFTNKIQNHTKFMHDNARPNIEISCEIDKFRGFLQDVLSFEPDFILHTEKPRLHYFDEDQNQILIHDLVTQNTTKIGIRNVETLPKHFTSIQAQSKIFLIGGELKENEIRTVLAKDCFLVNEQTFEIEKRGQMKHGRCGHQLVHLHRRFEYKTKDYIYAVGNKYPDETAKKCEVFDLAKNKWSEIGDLNQGRHYQSMCIIEGRYLFVIGGRNSMSEQPLDSIERLDCFQEISNQKWELLQIVNREGHWSARDTMGSFRFNDTEILIFGGDQGWISDCFNFNTKTNEIERMECSLKKPEEFFKSNPVHYNDKIFVVGCLDKDVHVFTPKVKKWFLLEKWFVDW